MRDSSNPFVRYRWLLDSYRAAIKAGWSDEAFVDLVERFDRAVAAVDGRGFHITPLTREPQLAARVGVGGTLWVKDDTGNVGGSHKARHLFGTLLRLALDEEQGELVIASCGNAALAAAIVARAADRPLRVFIPTWASKSVVDSLESLDATVEICVREPDLRGDPTVRAMLESIGRGAVPFSVQGTITESAIDGGRTFGWELAEQLARARVSGRVDIFVQVGGGALAAAVWEGVTDGIREQWLAIDPVLHTVQSEAVAPLNRAWRKLAAIGDREAALAAAKRDPDAYMSPWEGGGISLASGILDDVTYDWIAVVEAMFASGGEAHVVTEEMIVQAHASAHELTTIDVDPTGSAGLAALFDPVLAERLGDHVVVLFTGKDRHLDT